MSAKDSELPTSFMKIRGPGQTRETISTPLLWAGQGESLLSHPFLDTSEPRREADVGSQMSTSLLLAGPLVISHYMAVLVCRLLVTRWIYFPRALSSTAILYISSAALGTLCLLC